MFGMSMTLEDLGNIGEFIASIGVPLSLIYLAFQIRDNSRFVQENTSFLRSTNDTGSNDHVTVTRQILFDHPDLLEIQRKGNRGSELTPEDLPKYELLTRSAFEGHFTYFVQYTKGLTNDEVWAYWSKYFDSYCEKPGVIKWWSNARHDFDPAFQEYVDAKMKNT
jgi:hypothetical protein